jgi:hypothetical protein
MLQGEMPFGSWRQSELDTLAKVAKGQVLLPSTFSIEAVDLITKVCCNYWKLMDHKMYMLSYSPKNL